MCEPQLGTRLLDRMMRGPQDLGLQELPLVWVLNLSHGAHSLLDISDGPAVLFGVLKRGADALVERLLRMTDDQALT